MQRLAPALLAVASLSLAACGSGGDGGSAAPDGERTGSPAVLETRTVDAGEVTVTVDPVAIGDEDASFAITLDTHSVELDMDIAKDATLEVGGEPWTDARWKGDGPSGHHREGTLSFVAGGQPNGTARLELGGFDEPVVAEWGLTG